MSSSSRDNGGAADPLDYGRRAAELRAERAEVARELRAAGLSLADIADRLGVTKPTVVDDLRGTDAEVTPDEWMRTAPGGARRGAVADLVDREAP
jgi:predicted transcriptional regulator